MPTAALHCDATDETISIYYELHGDDHAPNKLIMVMGFLCTSQQWSFLKPIFQNELPGWQVCIFDNRGCGKSAASPGKHYSTDLMAQDAVELCKYLGWLDNGKSVHVGGVSMGGMICQKLALKLQDRGQLASVLLMVTTRKMVGWGIFGWFWRLWFQLFLQYWFVRMIMHRYVSWLGYDRLVKGFIRSCYSQKFLNMKPKESDIALLSEEERKVYEVEKPQTNKEYLFMRYRLNHQNWLDFSADCMASQMFALQSHYVSQAELSKLRSSGVAITVLCATHDNLIPFHQQRKLAADLCADTLVMIGGHVAMREHKVRFIHSFKAHLQRALVHLEHLEHMQG